MSHEVIFSFVSRLSAEDFLKKVHDEFPGMHGEIKDVKDQD